MKLLTDRRKAAIVRLQEQLIAGIKPRKNGKKWSDYPEESLKIVDKKPVGVLLTPKDISRINKEIEVLKSRV